MKGYSTTHIVATTLLKLGWTITLANYNTTFNYYSWGRLQKDVYNLLVYIQISKTSLANHILAGDETKSISYFQCFIENVVGCCFFEFTGKGPVLGKTTHSRLCSTLVFYHTCVVNSQQLINQSGHTLPGDEATPNGRTTNITENLSFHCTNRAMFGGQLISKIDPAVGCY